MMSLETRSLNETTFCLTETTFTQGPKSLLLATGPSKADVSGTPYEEFNSGLIRTMRALCNFQEEYLCTMTGKVL